MSSAPRDKTLFAHALSRLLAGLQKYLVPWGKVAKANKCASNTKLEEEVVAYIKDQIKDF
jgi:hypothetical protein